MNFTRRHCLFAGGSALALAACQPAPPDAAPGSVTVAASMSGSANPGPDGSGRPMTVTLVQLRATDAFAASDFVALQNAQATLAADLVRADTLVLAPGGSANGSYPVEVAQGATALGIIAGYRDPGGKIFRQTVSLPATGDVPLTLTVGPSGVSVS